MRRVCLALSLLAFSTASPAWSQVAPGGTCPPSVDAVAPLDSIRRAVTCAEWFIVQQGFTDRPVTDTNAIVWDILDHVSESRAAALARRTSTLRPHAYGICVNPNDRAGYIVVFLHAFAAGADSSARGVWMSRGFAHMRVVHQDLRLAAVDQREVGCRPLGSAFNQRQQN